MEDEKTIKKKRRKEILKKVGLVFSILLVCVFAFFLVKYYGNQNTLDYILRDVDADIIRINNLLPNLVLENRTIENDSASGAINYSSGGNMFNIRLQFNLTGNYEEAGSGTFLSQTSNGYKFGWNRTFSLPSATNDTPVRARYLIRSNNNLRASENTVIGMDRFVRESNSIFGQINRREELHFNDVCSIIVGGADLTPVNPRCNLSRVDERTYQLDFTTEYNFLTGGIFIDPQLNITSSPSTSATYLNVTVRAGNFTHLSINTDLYSINSSNVKLYFPFDTNTSNIQYSYSPNSLNGTIVGNVSHTSNGKIGGGIYMSGNGAYVSIPSIDLIEETKNDGFTMSTWFKTDQNASIPADKYLAYQLGGNVLFWRMNTASLKIEFILYNITGSSKTSTINSVPDKNWHHIVAVYNKTTIYQFVDGVKQTSTATFFGDPATVGSGFTLSTSLSASRAWNGTLDEFMFLNKSLTDNEIVSLYNNQSSRFFPRGEVIYSNLNVSGVGTENTVNVTVGLNNYFNSNVTVAVGSVSGGGYSYGSEYNLTNGFVSAIPMTTPNNISLKIIHYAGNSSSNSYISPNVFNATIDSYVGGTPPTDSCTYSSGNWNVNCWDNCSITSNVNLGGENNISIIGAGSFTNSANITGWRKLLVGGACRLRNMNGGKIV